MILNIITQEQFQVLMDKIELITQQLRTTYKNPKEIIYDSSALQNLLNISKSTLQKLRDGGYIGFSQINGKFFYRQSDINDMIEKNYKAPFQ